jgi:hypothetical protein
VRTPTVLGLFAAALGGCAGDGAVATRDAPAVEPAATDRRAVDGTALRFVGTMVQVRMREDFDPRHRWVVVARVEKVLEGTYDDETFAFVVHSPSQEGLEEGRRCEVRAERMSETKYRFVEARPSP